MLTYRVLDEFSGLFAGKKYKHRDSSLGDWVARHLFEDLYDLGKSKALRDRVEGHESVLNAQNKRRGIPARRGDGTFGEVVPGVVAVLDAGFAVARGEISTIEIGVEVKILAKAMLKQIGRVESDLRDQVDHFNRRAAAPICVGIVGINRAERCVSYEGDRAWPSMDGSKPAICGRLKTGHFRRPETGVEIYFTASSVGKVFAGALALAVTPEASGQLDSLQYRQIQIADLLEQLRGRGPGRRFRQRVPPLPVLFLQLQERLHGVVPLLWPRSPVRWPTVPDPGFAGLAPLPVTCLPLGVGQRHTAMLHRYVTDQRGAVGRAIEAQAWRHPPLGCHRHRCTRAGWSATACAR